ncbi:MAG: hypothetical protein RR346_09535 [Bacteroidales bacterium]
MEITELFEFYFSQFQDIALAEENFRENMQQDPELKKHYKEWCDEMGYTERKGFKSYFMNKSDSENFWEAMYPNREELEEYDFDTK